jgi:hypothetical protein
MLWMDIGQISLGDPRARELRGQHTLAMLSMATLNLGRELSSCPSKNLKFGPRCQATSALLEDC